MAKIRISTKSPTSVEKLMDKMWEEQGKWGEFALAIAAAQDFSTCAVCGCEVVSGNPNLNHDTFILSQQVGNLKLDVRNMHDRLLQSQGREAALAARVRELEGALELASAQVRLLCANRIL